MKGKNRNFDALRASNWLFMVIYKRNGLINIPGVRTRVWVWGGRTACPQQALNALHNECHPDSNISVTDYPGKIPKGVDLPSDAVVEDNNIKG
ncbi:hypothetical protein YC2023_040379 [Brassica napus]